MERLWAPWRMAYINGGLQKVECFLCAAAGHPSDDEANLVIWRGEKVFCIMNRFPYNNGHLMVAPLRHGGEMAELAAEERAALMDGVIEMKGVLERAVRPHGFNIGLNIGRSAGAGLVDHVHFHIVPRWDGDTNFMPVLADTKVMPESLSDMYVKLSNAIHGGKRT